MMDPTFYERILSWNNVAVGHLLDGKSSDCLEVLRYALNQLQNALQVQATTDTFGKSLTSSSYPPSSTGARTQFRSLAINNKSNNNVSSSDTTGNGTFAFFNRMITLAATNEVNSSQLLCMLFFNLAVVHHHLGLQQGQSTQLNTSLQLYQLAFSVVEGQSNDFLLGDQQMLLLALYNNMGHIHSCFSRTPETQACVQWIQQIFMANKNVAAVACPSLQACDFQFFVQYMSVRASTQGTIASAA